MLAIQLTVYHYVFEEVVGYLKISCQDSIFVVSLTDNIINRDDAYSQEIWSILIYFT